MDYNKWNNSPMVLHIIDNIYVSKSPGENYQWFNIYKHINGINANKSFKLKYIFDLNDYNNNIPQYNINFLTKYYNIVELNLNPKLTLSETKLDEILNILDTKYERDGILIMSNYGINRPSLIIIPYLCKKYNLDAESASRLFYYKIFDAF